MSGIRPALRRYRWDLERFGLVPSKIPARLGRREAPRVLSNSLPKAGTHLVERALCLHPWLYRSLHKTVNDKNVAGRGGFEEVIGALRPGQVAVTHLSYTSDRQAMIESEGVRHVFIVRDPRDIVVSQIHYIARNERHRHHRRLVAEEGDAHRMRLIVLGDADAGVVSMRSRLEAFAPWLERAFVLRFEDLVGARGGGDDVRSRADLAEMFEYIGVPMAEGLLEVIADRAFSSVSPTFRRGSTGEWQETFDDATGRLVDRELGDLIERYGYS